MKELGGVEVAQHLTLAKGASLSLSCSLKQAKQTTFYKFEEGISFAEHWKLVAESSEFHLTLKRAHRVHFFQLEICQKSGTF